jgi:hypothetical protein
MSWGASEWSVVVGAASAFATAAAGFMALIAAKWTVEETRKSADSNSQLLKEQIEVQRQELQETRNAALEVERKGKLHAAYTISRLAGLAEMAIHNAMNNTSETDEIRPNFSEDLIRQIEGAYPLQSFLSRNNHINFQILDATVHGQTMKTRERAQQILWHLNELRNALTPVIVGLPLGEGDRSYGSGRASQDAQT